MVTDKGEQADERTETVIVAGDDQDVPFGVDEPADADPVADETDGEYYTIDELASLSGVPSRTIRFYQSKGTLPAPERRGRVAFYQAEHVERLKLIAELQDRGLRLDAIRDALLQIEKGGDSLQQWLGVGDELQAPWSDDQPIVISEIDLVARLGGQRPGLIAELIRVGMIERKGNSRPAMFIVPSPGLLEIGITLDESGIDPTTAFEASAIMRRSIAGMSDDLVEFFAQRAGQGFGRSGHPDQIGQSFEAVRPEGLRAVQLIFAQEMERALRDFVEKGGAMRRAKGHEPRSKSSGKRSERKPDRGQERREIRERR